MRAGKQTFCYERPPRIAAHASIVGPKESKGPLAAYFDEASQDDLFGQKTWELGESEMLRRCAGRAMREGGLTQEETQAFFSGDLNNQIIATGFAARALGLPFVGRVRRLWKDWFWLRRSSAADTWKTPSAPLPATSARLSDSFAFRWRWAHNARLRPTGRLRQQAVRFCGLGKGRGFM